MSVFNEKIDRTHTSSVKWERTKEIFGEEFLWPMWVADMDFRPPQVVLDALKSRVEHGIFGYTFVPATTTNSIVNWLKKRHDWQIDSSELLYCSGIVQAISSAIQTFSEKGDKILLHSPVYTPFFEMIEKNERIVVNSPLILIENHYEIDFEDFEKELQKGCKLFILCSPHNPVGRVWSREELSKVAELCLQYNCLILSDEIHSDIIFQKYHHYPIASLSKEIAKQVVTFIAPSKTFNLAGLQSSIVIINDEALRTRFNNTLKRQGLFSLNTFGIIAMEAAYRGGEAWLEELITYLQENLELANRFLKEHLPQISCIQPEGTYLLWLDCRRLGISDDMLQELLLKKGRLALEPGKKYGPGGEGFVRMNIACPREDLIEGLQRFKKAFV